MIDDGYVLSVQITAVIGKSYGARLTQFSRPRRELPQFVDTSAGSHNVDPIQWFECSDEHCHTITLFTRHDVSAQVDAVASIHIEVAWRPEHGLIAFGGSAIRVRGGIFRAHICFGFDDSA